MKTILKAQQDQQRVECNLRSLKYKLECVKNGEKCIVEKIGKVGDEIEIGWMSCGYTTTTYNRHTYINTWAIVDNNGHYIAISGTAHRNPIEEIQKFKEATEHKLKNLCKSPANSPKWYQFSEKKRVEQIHEMEKKLTEDLTIWNACIALYDHNNGFKTEYEELRQLRTQRQGVRLRIAEINEQICNIYLEEDD